jgi:photosystem II stability/assembly factor-like uncharacterized protein
LTGARREIAHLVDRCALTGHRERKFVGWPRAHRVSALGMDPGAARGAAAGALIAAMLLLAAQPSAPAAQPRAAEPAPLAARTLLIAIAAAGERLVAVGDRGIIVSSDDRGTSWTQAAGVPSDALLTGV